MVFSAAWDLKSLKPAAMTRRSKPEPDRADASPKSETLIALARLLGRQAARQFNEQTAKGNRDANETDEAATDALDGRAGG